MVVLMIKNMQLCQEIVARFGALLVGSECKRGGDMLLHFPSISICWLISPGQNTRPHMFIELHSVEV